ncbi:hypothetical protein BD289DRAFT_438982 [Coniella lustricola]|uniref:Uncharacterized protein n=1 Tax=Coniella lustricola TaxID=2025994 RepID=A0A2T3A287_9PEZI|nr:hypothetical protein BD289DRAFT_438982 [Coniella lustricola]
MASPQPRSSLLEPRYWHNIASRANSRLTFLRDRDGIVVLPQRIEAQSCQSPTALARAGRLSLALPVSYSLVPCPSAASLSHNPIMICLFGDSHQDKSPICPTTSTKSFTGGQLYGEASWSALVQLMTAVVACCCCCLVALVFFSWVLIARALSTVSISTDRGRLSTIRPGQ